MEEFPDGLVVSGAAVGHGQGVHPRPAQYGVLVRSQLLDEGVGLLQTPVHREGYAHGQPS